MWDSYEKKFKNKFNFDTLKTHDFFISDSDVQHSKNLLLITDKSFIRNI